MAKSSQDERVVGKEGEERGDTGDGLGSSDNYAFVHHKVSIPPRTPLVKGFGMAVKETFFHDVPLRRFRNLSLKSRLWVGLQFVFPILEWGRHYSWSSFRKDVVAGLTIGSLSIPQDIGDSKLANLPPEYGLYSSFVPPLVYSFLGSSRDIAIGPVAMVSILLGTMMQSSMQIPKSCDTTLSPSELTPECLILQNEYLSLAFTTTFFTGVFQAALGLLRLGFLVDFLSHATIVGFMAGSAIAIGLQQLKGLLGIPSSLFTKHTDIVSVMRSVWKHTNKWNWQTIAIGLFFLGFILITRITAKKKPKLFWVAAIAPITSVILSTAFVKLTRVDQHGVAIVNHLHEGINPSSWSKLNFTGNIALEAAKIAFVASLIALMLVTCVCMEAIAIARTFAALKDYHIDGNKEMIAMGVMNVAGSCTSCYVATGSFSRSAVNYNAGVQTTVSNIVLSMMVLVILTTLTPLFKYTPNCILASIIINAVLSLIDIKAVMLIWKIDKLDFLACLGAFLGVLFISIEIGLVIAVSISIAKILFHVTRPHTALLGSIPGTNIYRNVEQYPDASRVPGIVIVRIDAAIYFSNSSYIHERILRWVEDEEERIIKSQEMQLQFIIIEMSPVTNIDTTGIHAFEELYTALKKRKLQLAFSNPGYNVLEKLNEANFIGKVGQEWFFLTAGEAVQVCSRLLTPNV